MIDFPITMPKHLCLLTYRLPLESDLTGEELEVYAARASERLSEVFFVTGVEPHIVAPSLVQVAEKTVNTGETGWTPYIEVMVDVRLAKPNTPCKIEKILMEALERDDADKSEGSPPASVS